MTRFSLRTPRMLEVDLAGDSVRALAGSMVSYLGDVEFKRSSIGAGEGFAGAVKRRATGESLELMDCTGHGTVQFAADAAHLELVELTGDQLKVESSSLLALETDLRTGVEFAGLRGASSGQGLFTTTVSGHGSLALVSHGGPLIALEVSNADPLVVDPDAYVASRGSLTQSFVTDVSWRSLAGTSGESYSLRFEGSGVVFIQPQERS